jgi:hypothetical protein
VPGRAESSDISAPGITYRHFGSVRLASQLPLTHLPVSRTHIAIPRVKEQPP